VAAADSDLQQKNSTSSTALDKKIPSWPAPSATLDPSHVVRILPAEKEASPPPGTSITCYEL